MVETSESLDQHFPGVDAANFLEIYRHWLGAEALGTEHQTLGSFVEAGSFEPPEAKGDALRLAKKFDRLKMEVKEEIRGEVMRLMHGV